MRRLPKCSVRVTCRKGTLDLGKSLALGVLDISETGIRLLVSEPLNSDQEVAITLDSINHLRPLRIIGRVVWCMETANKQYCTGIRFDKRLRYMEVTKLT
jgi:hypothetical protein